jgi:hypothetical protein
LRVASFFSFPCSSCVPESGINNRGEKGVLQQLSYAKQRHKVDRGYQLWQEGNQPVLISSEDLMRQKLEYMHTNPVRRGYVNDPTEWRYSSARNYAGGEGLMQVTRDW